MDGGGKGGDDDGCHIFQRDAAIALGTLAAELPVLTGKRAVWDVDADDVVRHLYSGFG